MCDYPRRRVREVAAALGAAATLSCATAQSQLNAPPGAAAQYPAAAFVFQATVVRLRSATLEMVPASANTVVIRVDSIMRSPGVLAHYTGHEVTLWVATPGGLSVGQRATFFADPWLLGDGVALKEVHRVPGPTPRDFDRAVGAVVQQEADRQLRQRMAEAQLVVAGAVTEIADPRIRARIITEHDPMWRRATVRVRELIKGTGQPGTVSFLFPSSRDVMWQAAPKFEVEQTGVWILRTDAQLDAYVVADSLDYLDERQVERVRALLRQGGR